MKRLHLQGVAMLVLTVAVLAGAGGSAMAYEPAHIPALEQAIEAAPFPDKPPYYVSFTDWRALEAARGLDAAEQHSPGAVTQMLYGFDTDPYPSAGQMIELGIRGFVKNWVWRSSDLDWEAQVNSVYVAGFDSQFDMSQMIDQLEACGYRRREGDRYLRLSAGYLVATRCSKADPREGSAAAFVAPYIAVDATNHLVLASDHQGYIGYALHSTNLKRNLVSQISAAFEGYESFSSYMGTRMCHQLNTPRAIAGKNANAALLAITRKDAKHPPGKEYRAFSYGDRYEGRPHSRMVYTYAGPKLAAGDVRKRARAFSAINYDSQLRFSEYFHVDHAFSDGPNLILDTSDPYGRKHGDPSSTYSLRLLIGQQDLSFARC